MIMEMTILNRILPLPPTKKKNDSIAVAMMMMKAAKVQLASILAVLLLPHSRYAQNILHLGS